MTRLSLPIENLRAHYTVVVVGSGYGGAVAASRLARAGQQVCVLERGREMQPGEYPDTNLEAVQEMQVDLPDGRVGSPTGLFDFRVNSEINVFLGCGLGGTSLVNANVALPPDPRVFADERWPKSLRADLRGAFAEGLKHAQEMLRPVPYPEGQPRLKKLEAQRESAKHMGASSQFHRVPIAVNFEDGKNHVGVEQKACVLCGDCVSGCNHSAKNTVLMNYLPDAVNHGAEIFTEVRVRRVEPKDDRWLVHYVPVGAGREVFGAPELFVSADIVVLGAGTLGSTEILLRSKAAGLPASDQLGRRFTGNGDVLAFGYNNDATIDGIGHGSHPAAGREPVGPCITSVIDLRATTQLEKGMVIEEGSVPGPLAAFTPHALSAAAKLVGVDTDKGVVDEVRESMREVASKVRGPYTGATRNTQTYLVMAHDDAGGRMVLRDDRLRIEWPGVGRQKIFEEIDARLRQATAALGGTFVKNPIWHKMLRHSLITVHPLGGCAMGDQATQGVTNHKGQVFSGPSGDGVHRGLYVCDGAIIPRPLGTNPLLTISALAERCATLIAKDRGWKIDYTLPMAAGQSPNAIGPSPGAAGRTPGSRSSASLKTGFQFTETMRGYFSTSEKKDFERGARQGREDESPFEFTLTVTSNDLDDLLKSPEHRARMVGTASAPALSDHALAVSEGHFSLLSDDPERVGQKRMLYSMRLTDPSGRAYAFEGFKLVHDDKSLDLWRDTTTLFITLFDGPSSTSPVLGKGVLHIEPADFLRQMTTMQARNARTPAEKLRATARFGQFFAGSLFDTYGGIFARPTAFDPDAPPRKKRPLRVSAPELHPFTTSDGVPLLLTRYRGGTKGPVFLSHGLGVSSRIFSIDTIDTNLLEYLFAHGYNVWLLDYRASTDLPASNTQFSADEIAERDYPAAVQKMRSVTGAAKVDAVVHCFGSTTFFMAMLAGLQGIRSAVCSQIATHIKAPTMTRIKTGLYVPTILDALGVKSLTAYVDKNANWLEQLYDQALKLFPIEHEERAASKTHQRIHFMYGPLYELDQLNRATYDALHEMFGIANMRAFEHVALLCRKGHLVGADGSERYMNRLERLAIPITFLHGAENECFLPESTETTVKVLREKNGKHLYSRHVFAGYGHIDCIFGKNAVRDVYPAIAHHLELVGGHG